MVRVIIRVDSKTPVTGCYELVGHRLGGRVWLGIVGLIGHLLGGYWVD